MHAESIILGMELREQALKVLRISDAVAKAAATSALAAGPALVVDEAAALHCDVPLPGRQARPRLVPPSQVPARSP